MFRVALHPLLVVLLSALGAVGPAGLHGWIHVDAGHEDHGHAHQHVEGCDADGHADDRLESRRGQELAVHDAHCAVCLLVRQAPREADTPPSLLDDRHAGPALAADRLDVVRPAPVASPVGARAPPVCG